MSLTATRPLNPALWLGGPMLGCLVATLVFALPVRVLGLPLPEPMFGLAPAFAWAVIRPSILPPFALIVLGLVCDLFWGGPLGFWPLCLLGAYAPVLLIRQALSGQDAWVMCGLYALTVALALLIGVVLATAMGAGTPGLAGLFWQWLATTALFPVVHRLIIRYEDADVRFR